MGVLDEGYIMRTSLNIYVFITITGSITQLVNYWFPRVSSPQ